MRVSPEYTRGAAGQVGGGHVHSGRSGRRQLAEAPKGPGRRDRLLPRLDQLVISDRLGLFVLVLKLGIGRAILAQPV